jgi:hypothetical protein
MKKSVKIAAIAGLAGTLILGACTFFIVQRARNTVLETGYVNNVNIGIIKIVGGGPAYADPAGNSQILYINISRHYSHDSGELECTYSQVNISGAGDAAMLVTWSFRVYVSGDGAIMYYGNPTVYIALSGRGSAVPAGTKQYY